MTTTAIVAQHGITIETVRHPAGHNLPRASCPCGWQSAFVGSRSDGVDVGQAHIAGTGPNPGPDLATGPIVCAPWCQYGDGHPEAAFSADQWCGGVMLRVDLTGEPQLAVGGYDQDLKQWTPGPDYVSVYAHRTGPGAATQVEIARGLDGANELRFTVGEARQLVEALQLVLGQVQQV